MTLVLVQLVSIHWVGLGSVGREKPMRMGGDLEKNIDNVCSALERRLRWEKFNMHSEREAAF